MSKTSSPARNDLITAFKWNFFPALIALAALLLKYPPDAKKEIQSALMSGITQQPSVPMGMLRFYLLGMITVGAVMAIASFSFMLSKSKSDMFLSAAVTRTRLYINRVVSAVVLLTVAVAVPIGVLIRVNFSAFGYSASVLIACTELGGVLFTAGVIGFSAGTAACMLAGNIPEAAALTGGFLAIPHFILTAADMLAVKLLSGSGFFRFSEDIVSQYTGSLYDELSFLNPLRFALFPDEISPYIINLPQNASDDVTVEFYNMLPFVLWGAVSAAVLIAGWALLKRRRPERMCEILPSAAEKTVFAFVCAAALLVNLYEKYPDSFWVCFLLSLAAFSAVGILLWRGVKPFLKQSYTVAAYALPIIAVYLSLANGGLGYSERIPAWADIERVRLSAIQSSYHAQSVEGGMWMSFEDEREQAQKLYRLHKQLIDDSLRGSRDKTISVWIEYELENGKTSARRYRYCSDRTFEYFKSLEVYKDITKEADGYEKN